MLALIHGLRKQLIGFGARNGGLGMGLAIYRRVVEAGGGCIWAENTGQGARFSFKLPLADCGRYRCPVNRRQIGPRSYSPRPALRLASREIRIRHLDQQVVMVRHQAT